MAGWPILGIGIAALVAAWTNGRRTLAILVGVDGSRVFYASILATSVILCVVGAVSGSGALVVAAALLPAVLLIRRLASLPVGPALNGLLAHTARFQLLLALLVALGLAVA